VSRETFEPPIKNSSKLDVCVIASRVGETCAKTRSSWPRKGQTLVDFGTN
jgi:hypothetical protein